MQSLARYFSSIGPGRARSFGESSEFPSAGGVCPALIGGALHVADENERRVVAGGIDGFDVIPAVSSGFADFVDLVVPELRRCGLVRTDHAGTTRRGHDFGAGMGRLADDHPRAAQRFGARGDERRAKR